MSLPYKVVPSLAQMQKWEKDIIHFVQIQQMGRVQYILEQVRATDSSHWTEALKYAEKAFPNSDPIYHWDTIEANSLELYHRKQNAELDERLLRNLQEVEEFYKSALPELKTQEEKEILRDFLFLNEKQKEDFDKIPPQVKQLAMTLIQRSEEQVQEKAKREAKSEIRREAKWESKGETVNEAIKQNCEQQYQDPNAQSVWGIPKGIWKTLTNVSRLKTKLEQSWFWRYRWYIWIIGLVVRFITMVICGLFASEGLGLSEIIGLSAGYIIQPWLVLLFAIVAVFSALSIFAQNRVLSSIIGRMIDLLIMKPLDTIPYARDVLDIMKLPSGIFNLFASFKDIVMLITTGGCGVAYEFGRVVFSSVFKVFEWVFGQCFFVLSTVFGFVLPKNLPDISTIPGFSDVSKLFGNIPKIPAAIINEEYAAIFKVIPFAKTAEPIINATFQAAMNGIPAFI